MTKWHFDISLIFSAFVPVVPHLASISEDDETVLLKPAPSFTFVLQFMCGKWMFHLAWVWFPYPLSHHVTTRLIHFAPYLSTRNVWQETQGNIYLGFEYITRAAHDVFLERKSQKSLKDCFRARFGWRKAAPIFWMKLPSKDVYRTSHAIIEKYNVQTGLKLQLKRWQQRNF